MVGNVNATKSCQQKCQENPDCHFWYNNFNSKMCYLLREGIPQTESELCNPGNCNRGPRICPQGIQSGFFSLAEAFIGIGMGLGGGEMWDKHFGNMQHPTA